MCGCLIVFKSITYAQRAQYVLSCQGISAAITRTPSGVVGKSCTYAVRVAEEYRNRAIQILNNKQINYVKVITLFKNGEYREENL